jgi:hypothetical protein
MSSSSSSLFLSSPSSSTTTQHVRGDQGQERILRQPDKIVWDHEYAYRQSPDCLLHHQKGVMGFVEVCLLEASNLQRSLERLGLLGSRRETFAQGEISSFAQISLNSTTTNTKDDVMTSPAITNNNHPCLSNRHP